MPRTLFDSRAFATRTCLHSPHTVALHVPLSPPPWRCTSSRGGRGRCRDRGDAPSCSSVPAMRLRDMAARMCAAVPLSAPAGHRRGSARCCWPGQRRCSRAQVCNRATNRGVFALHVPSLSLSLSDRSAAYLALALPHSGSLIPAPSVTVALFPTFPPSPHTASLSPPRHPSCRLCLHR